MKLFSLILLLIISSCKAQTNPTTAINTTPNLNVSSAHGIHINELDTSIWYVFQDSKLNYWFGSNGKGVYRYAGKLLTQFTSKDGLPNNQIRGIQEDKLGNIFITTTAGITKYDGQKFTTPAIQESTEWKLEASDLWFSILGEKNGKGVYRYDGENLYHLNFPKNILEDDFYKKYPNAAYSPYEVYSIYKDKRGALWFGTACFGLYRYDGKTLGWLYEDQLTNTPEGGSFGIRSIYEDSKANFWICNSHYRYEIATTHTRKNGMNLIDTNEK